MSSAWHKKADAARQTTLAFMDLQQTPPRTPACFPDRYSFDTWRLAAHVTGGCSEAKWCTDCTPEYKERMTKANRCECQNITFARDEDGFLQGVTNGTANHPSN